MTNIVEKIKKLLRLSKSPFPHEAELAMERAFELAARHKIEIDSLDLGEELNRVVQDSVRLGFRLSLPRKLSLNIVNTFFNVTAVISYPVVKFVGTPADIAIARHVSDFLTESCRHELDLLLVKHGRPVTEVRRRSFVFGFFYGISSQLRGRKEQLCIENNQVALVLAKNDAKRKEFVADNIGKTAVVVSRKPKRIQKDFLAAGYVRGKNTLIRSAIDQQEERQELTA